MRINGLNDLESDLMLSLLSDSAIFQQAWSLSLLSKTQSLLQSTHVRYMVTMQAWSGLVTYGV